MLLDFRTFLNTRKIDETELALVKYTPKKKRFAILNHSVVNIYSVINFVKFKKILPAFRRIRINHFHFFP